MSEPPRPIPPPSERRQSLRIPCDLPIQIAWGDVSLDGRVTEISVEGMFIEITAPLWIGARFDAILELPSPVKVECVVRRVVPRAGMAVTYGVSGDLDRVAISALLHRLSQK